MKVPLGFYLFNFKSFEISLHFLKIFLIKTLFLLFFLYRVSNNLFSWWIKLFLTSVELFLFYVISSLYINNISKYTFYFLFYFKSLISYLSFLKKLFLFEYHFLVGLSYLNFYCWAYNSNFRVVFEYVLFLVSAIVVVFIYWEVPVQKHLRSLVMLYISVLENTNCKKFLAE